MLHSAAAYLSATGSGGADPDAVAERGRAAGLALGEQPATAVEALVSEVLPKVAQAGDPVIATIGGGMRLSDYLPTRTFELVVHGLDVARAAGLAPAPLSADLLAEVAVLAATVATQRGHGIPLLLALTGREPLPVAFSVV